MKRAGTSEKYQNNNLKAIIAYSKFLGPSISFFEVEHKGQIISFLDTKIKNSEEDPDKRWITTWNDYLVRINIFSDGCIIAKIKTLMMFHFQNG
jgi:hypothetical protein